MRNALEHGAAGEVLIQLTFGPEDMVLTVQDDGKGFDASVETGLGILGMQERVARLGGSLKVESERGRGSIVSFELPLPMDLDERQAHEHSVDVQMIQTHVEREVVFALNETEAEAIPLQR